MFQQSQVSLIIFICWEQISFKNNYGCPTESRSHNYLEVELGSRAHRPIRGAASRFCSRDINAKLHGRAKALRDLLMPPLLIIPAIISFTVL